MPTRWAAFDFPLMDCISAIKHNYSWYAFANCSVTIKFTSTVLWPQCQLFGFYEQVLVRQLPIPGQFRNSLKKKTELQNGVSCVQKFYTIPQMKCTSFLNLPKLTQWNTEYWNDLNFFVIETFPWSNLQVLWGSLVHSNKPKQNISLRLLWNI